ncbi:MAG: hypothetical protein MUP63_00840 [Candidatus Nanohaloarchaeota archaeon QJJ-7]|nr:hypothetical protein [Candidatus Nanohaloarchaeota archaeon QJJ-7]
MGLIRPFKYTNSEGETYFLHKSEKGDRTNYYFSKNPEGSLRSRPSGFKVKENPHSHMPYLKRGRGGILGSIMELLGMSTESGT